MKTVVFASDHAGYTLRLVLIQLVQDKGYTAIDLGCLAPESVDYPDYADKLAETLRKHPSYVGVLICGSGIGISIAANRHRHIRCALVSNPTEARLSRQHNDANVIAMGERLIGEEVARQSVLEFLTHDFEGNRHQRRIDKMS